MSIEIEEGLKCIFNTIATKSDEEVISLLGDAIIYLGKSDIELDDPDNFNHFINFKLNRAVELLANNIHEQSTCIDKNKPNFIYANYSFLESHIEKLCATREGSSCCADKSRYILNMFLKYSINGKIPCFDPNLEKYWIPNFGDNMMWIDYCDSLYDLYYGNTESYLKAYNNLLTCEKRKFKHLLHRWYVELNDGDIIEIGRSWDDNLNCPLDRFSDKGDYHIIYKNLAKEKNFEEYVPAEDDDECSILFAKHYVKLPKSSIKKIYHKTKEQMI